MLLTAIGSRLRFKTLINHHPDKDLNLTKEIHFVKIPVKNYSVYALVTTKKWFHTVQKILKDIP